jgi:hypothetical protein
LAQLLYCIEVVFDILFSYPSPAMLEHLATHLLQEFPGVADADGGYVSKL